MSCWVFVNFGSRYVVMVMVRSIFLFSFIDEYMVWINVGVVELSHRPCWEVIFGISKLLDDGL